MRSIRAKLESGQVPGRVSKWDSRELFEGCVCVCVWRGCVCWEIRHEGEGSGGSLKGQAGVDQMRKEGGIGSACRGNSVRLGTE